MSVQARPVDKNPRREDVKAHHPRSPKSKHSLEGFRQATWTKRQNNKEEGRDVQVKKKGNIQIKYPSSAFNALH